MNANRMAVPFFPSGSATDPNFATQVASLLTSRIAEWQASGWRFSHFEEVKAYAQPGCFAALFGAQAQTTSIQLAILDRM